jgi:hypothetical protein
MISSLEKTKLSPKMFNKVRKKLIDEIKKEVLMRSDEDQPQHFFFIRMQRALCHKYRFTVVRNIEKLELNGFSG